jgi:hypothetical protein
MVVLFVRYRSKLTALLHYIILCICTYTNRRWRIADFEDGVSGGGDILMSIIKRWLCTDTVRQFSQHLPQLDFGMSSPDDLLLKLETV